MVNKPPFFLVRNFISPLMCENIITDLGIHRTPPMMSQAGNPKEMLFVNKLNERRLADVFDRYIEELENHFGADYLGTHSIHFEWYPTGSKVKNAKSDGYVLDRDNQWVRNKEIDLVGILWLNDYNPNGDTFDESYEAYGGKLEFPNFNISFNPERGSLVVFPTAPNFVYTISDVYGGDMTVAKFTIRTEKPYAYDANKFNHDPTEWKGLTN